MKKVKGPVGEAYRIRSLILGHEVLEYENLKLFEDRIEVFGPTGIIKGKPEDYLIVSGDLFYVVDEETFDTLFTPVGKK